MTTSLRRSSARARLVALVADATARVTAAWRILTTAQSRLLSALAVIRPGRRALALTRAAALAFHQAVASFDRAIAGFTERWAATDLPAAYREGALAVLHHVDRPQRSWTWTARHQTALTTLTARFHSDLSARHVEAVRRARAFLRAALAVARARADGFSVPRFDGNNLLREHPLDTVADAHGVRRPVESWARDALSWQALSTAHTGALHTAAGDLHCTWIEVYDGPDCGWTGHDDPDRAHGTLRTVREALVHPLAHPHCRREFFPRPDITSPPARDVTDSF
ncbi:hypothetical protein [Streptomyces sp. NPDC058745]|uniref:hypothetical protein n=1 Tax=Streptomyces sp. NPDC058745 TaxID=3346621 RepID=UPI00369E0721